MAIPSIKEKETHYYVRDIHRFLGLQIQPDGTFFEFPPPTPIPNGGEIPEGWQFYAANNFGAGIYERRSRVLEVDDFGRQTIKPGGFVLCHNLLQRLECAQDDMTIMIGGQDASGFMIPTSDGKFVPCSSLFHAVANSAYSLSQISGGVSEIKVQCLKLFSLCSDILRAFGFPVGVKVLKVSGGNEGETAVPAFANQCPTVASMFSIVLANLGLVVAQGIKVVKFDED